VVCILLAFLFAEIIKTWELILPADDGDQTHQQQQQEALNE